MSKKFSELAEDTTFDGTEVLALVNSSGVSNKALLSNLSNFISPASQVFVSQESDYGTAVVGVITFGSADDGKVFTITQDVPITSRFVIEDGIRIGFNSIGNNMIELQYNGSNTLFTSSDFTNIYIENILIKGTAAGTLMNISGNGVFQTFKAAFEDFGTGGTSSNFFTQFTQGHFANFGQGFVFTDNAFGVVILTMGSFGWKNEVSTMFTFTGSSFGTATLNNLPIITNSNESLFDFDLSLRDNASRINVIAVVIATFSAGSVFATDSLKQDYINATFRANTGIDDSTISYDLSVLDNALTTVISSPDTPVPVNARLTSAEQERIVVQDRCTFDNTTDIVSATLEDGTTPFDHIMVADDVISFHPGSGGVLPTGIVEDKDYFLLADTSNTYQFSETKGGAAVDFTTDGSGIIYYRHIAGDNALSWMIYVGNETVRCSIVGDFSLQLVGGGTNALRGVLTKTDNSFVETIFRRGSVVSASSSNPQSSSVHGLVTLAQGEGVRLEVENADGASTSNIDVTALNITVTH